MTITIPMWVLQLAGLGVGLYVLRWLIVTGFILLLERYG